MNRLACLWFGAGRVSGAIVARLAGLLGAAGQAIGSPSDHRGGGSRRHVPTKGESVVAGED
jgi:hypothetical protein